MSDTETLVRPESPGPDQGRRRRENALWFTQGFTVTLVLAGFIWAGVTLVNAFTTPVSVPAHPIVQVSPSKARRSHLETPESAPVPVAPPPQTFTPVHHHRHRKVLVPAPVHTTPVPTVQPTTPLPSPTFTIPSPVQTTPISSPTSSLPTGPPTSSTALPTGVLVPAQEGTTSDGPGDLRSASASPLPHRPHAG